MTKRTNKSRKPASATTSGVNWYLIGGIAGGAVILLVAFVILATRGSGEGETLADIATRQSATATAAAELLSSAETELPAYCDANPNRCIRTGSADAPVKIFEVSDYGCGHCKTFNQVNAPIIEERYVDTGQVEFIILPSSLIGGQTMDSAAAVLCAADQGQGAAYHHQIFEYQDGRVPTRQDQLELADRLNLDSDAFGQCLRGNDALRAAQETTAFIQQLGANSTPTFWINGERIAGNDLAGIERAIRNELPAQ
jgi:protein-disulfide isomerase